MRHILRQVEITSPEVILWMVVHKYEVDPSGTSWLSANHSLERETLIYEIVMAKIWHLIPEKPL